MFESGKFVDLLRKLKVNPKLFTPRDKLIATSFFKLVS